MTPEISPLKIELTEIVSRFDQHIVELTIHANKDVKAAMDGQALPLTLSNGSGDAEYQMGPDGTSVIKTSYRIPVGETHNVVAKMSLPNGVEVTGSIVIPPLAQYREDFVDRVAHGAPLENGEHFQVPDGEYEFDKDVVVQPGAVLRAGPGVQLRFDEGVGIYSEGTLIFKGTEDKAVYLGPRKDGGQWRGVTLNGPYAKYSALKGCYIIGGSGTRVESEKNKHGILKIIKEGGSTQGGALLITNMANQNNPLEIEGVTMTGNRADRGGALAVYNSTVALEHVGFHNNHAAISGGGLYSRHGVVLVNGPVEFKGNSAEVTGGAIAITHKSVLEDDGKNLILEGNTSGRQGAAVYNFFSSSDLEEGPNTLNVERRFK